MTANTCATTSAGGRWRPWQTESHFIKRLTGAGRSYDGKTDLCGKEAGTPAGGPKPAAGAADRGGCLRPGGPAPAEPLRRGGAGRGRLPPGGGDGVLRAPGGRCHRGPARRGLHRLRRGASAGAVRPAGGLRRPVHPADDPGGAAHGPHRQGLSAVRPPDGGGRGGGKAVRHQPGGVPGGLAGPAGEPGGGGRRPVGRGDGHGLHRPGPGGPGGPAGAAGPGHGPGGPDLPPGVFPGHGASGPHPDGGAGGGHLLVRPLPPHHLLHPPGRYPDRRPERPGGLSGLSGRPGGGLWGGEGGQAPPDPHGHRHHRRQVSQKTGPAPRAGRERGDQRLLHPRPRSGGRERAGLAPDV